MPIVLPTITARPKPSPSTRRSVFGGAGGAVDVVAMGAAILH
jgi:hypothetical protein